MTPDEILHGIHERAAVTKNTTVIDNQVISSYPFKLSAYLLTGHSC